MSTSATLHVASRPGSLQLTDVRLMAGVLPLIAPWGLLVAGALVGYPFSLDQPVALERLLGLLVAGVLASVASVGLRRVEHPTALLMAASVLALAGGVWVIVASGPDVFRGGVGNVLDTVFRPVFGRMTITDPVEVTNTRFIVGYNGLIDLCLVAIFCCGAVLLEPLQRRARLVPGAIVVVGLVLLVGAGARGGVMGLAGGICAVGLLLWPRRYALAALVAMPAAVGLAALSILDKGLEFSSTAGRITYWSDLARLLVEYPLTGVGLGIDTANSVALQYEINPDPERVFYAHNTFVQSYLELGPLGALGMLLVPGVVIAAALLARRDGVARVRRPLLVAGLAVVGGLEAHGLTDQVVTTNVGTGLLLLGVAAVLAGLSDAALGRLGHLALRGVVLVVAMLVVVAAAFVVSSGGRAQLLLNLGGLQMNQALALPQSPLRSERLADAEQTLRSALGQDGGHPAVLRDLAWVGSARFDDSAALGALQQATSLPRLDAFDMLQIAHVYRDLGVTDEAYAWASRAYTLTGRSFEDAVMQTYTQATLTDDRARTLATQAEAAMQARHFIEAHALFAQALTFKPASPYLNDRLGAAQRAIDKYGT